MPSRGTIFGAIFDPLDRATKPPGRGGDCNLFADARPFAAKTATDVFDDDPDIVLIQAEAAGDRFPSAISRLGGELNRQASPVEPGQRPPGLERAGDEPLIHEPFPDDDRGAIKCVLNRSVFRLLAESDVGIELRIKEWCVLLHRPLQIGHRRKRIELEFDKLQRIARNLA